MRWQQGSLPRSSSTRMGLTVSFSATRKQFFIQVLAVAVTLAYSFVGTMIIYKVVDWMMGMRVKEKDEIIGLDLTQHHEHAYTILE